MPTLQCFLSLWWARIPTLQLLKELNPFFVVGRLPRFKLRSNFAMTVTFSGSLKLSMSVANHSNKNQENSLNFA
ncbi:MAG: hypothetical protein IJ881_05390 [Neisseriaceae bacterium]|nr:hypothetical protein [Neisseriaceae bacterium]MBR3425113.1 hypothetical protein [Neisseriaceae bacterium]